MGHDVQAPPRKPRGEVVTPGSQSKQAEISPLGDFSLPGGVTKREARELRRAQSIRLLALLLYLSTDISAHFEQFEQIILLTPR